MRKLRSTVRMLYCLFMARTFGEYLHSTSGPNEADGAVYNWRGKRWFIPTSDVSDDGDAPGAMPNLQPVNPDAAIDEILDSLTVKQRDAILHAYDHMMSLDGYSFVTVKHTGEPWPAPIAQFLTRRRDRLTPLGLLVLAAARERRLNEA